MYKTDALFARVYKKFAPPPKFTLSQWADATMVLSRESSAEPGRWSTDRAPYQREMMDAISDPTVSDVVFMTSAQVGKTVMLLNAIGYFIDYDTSPMLYLMPTEAMAEDLSKDRIDPMIRDVRAIGCKVMTDRSTILHKRFAGGHLTLVGTNAAAGLSSRPIRVVFADEVDRYPADIGNEGDPLSLALKRTTTFWNAKHVMTSTPSIKGASRIETEYLTSTMEEWCLPCPACGVYAKMTWGNVKFDKPENEHETAVLHGMVCQQCGALSSEHDWKSGKGKWIAGYPERASKRGFHLNELVSPWKTWDAIVNEFLAACHDKAMLKTWINTALGETWEEQGSLSASELIAKRRQFYNCEVPDKAVVLTCAVDVQDNRLEYEVVGWGIGKESWGIRYGVLLGSPGETDVWRQLDDVLNAAYIRADGQPLHISTTCIDSGGHYTTEVYAYCRANEARRVWAIKGIGGAGRPFKSIPKSRNDAKVFVWLIGVDAGKDTIVGRLQIEFEGPGYCHFPIETERGYDEDYFDGLCSERRVTKYSNGQARLKWEKISEHARNEPFDLRNYATAALEILNPPLESLDKQLNQAKNEQKRAPIQPFRRRGTLSRGIEI